MKIHLYFSIIFIILILSSCSKDKSDSIGTNLSATEFSDKLKENPEATVIDVRTPEEFSNGHVANSININLNSDNFDSQISLIDKSKPVFVYCLSGNRSTSAAGKMRSAGFKEVYELKGGILKWKYANLPLTTGKTQAKNTSEGMTMKQFDDKINKNKLVLVDFYADWCAPCREIKPYLDEISKEMSDKVEVIRINVDENQELCRELKVDGIPDLRLFKNKSVVWNSTGYVQKKDILKNINSN